MPKKCCTDNLAMVSPNDFYGSHMECFYYSDLLALCFDCGYFGIREMGNKVARCKTCMSVICSNCHGDIVYLEEDYSSGVTLYAIVNQKAFAHRISPLLQNDQTVNLNRISLPLLKKVADDKVDLSSYTPRLKTKTTANIPVTILNSPSAIKEAALKEISECDVVFGLFYMLTDKDYMCAMQDKQTYLILQKNEANTSRWLQKLYSRLMQKEKISFGQTYKNLPSFLYYLRNNLNRQYLVPLTEPDPIRFIGSTYYANSKDKICHHGIMHCKLMVFAAYEGDCLIPYASLLGSSNFTGHALNNMEVGVMLHDVPASANLLNNIIWAGLLSEKFCVDPVEYIDPQIVLMSLDKIISRRDIWSLRPEIEEKYITKREIVTQDKDPSVFTII